MADLLQGLTNKPDALSGLVPSAETPTVTSNPDFTARLAAVGDVDVGAQMGAEVEALTEEYRQQIEVSGDNLLRTQAASRQNEAKLRALTNIAANPTEEDMALVEGARHAAGRVIADGIERDKEDALERRAIQQIQDLASTDPTQAKIRLNNLELGDAEDIIADYHTKKLILQREIDRAGIEKKDQAWFFDAVDFVMTAIPFNYSAGSVGNVDFPELVKSWGDNLLSGRRKRAEAAGLFNMSAPDMAKYVREELIPNVKKNSTLFGYHSRSEELSILSEIADTPSTFETNAWNTIDNFGGISAARLGKIASIPRIMVKNGARKQAGEAVARAVDVAMKEGAEKAAAKTGITPEEVADASLASAVNPSPSLNIPLSGETGLAADRAAMLEAKIKGALPSDRFASEEEVKGAIDKAVKEVEAEHGNPIADVKVNEIQLSTGSKVRDLELTFGKAEGGAFKTKKAAQAFLNSIDDAGEIVRDESGGYFVKITRNMPETGAYVQPLNPGQGSFLGVKSGGPIMDNILNARLVGDKLLADQAQRGTNQLNRIIKTVLKPITERINKMNARSKEHVGFLLSKSRKDGVWLDRDIRDIVSERTINRPLTDIEHDAYEAAREAQDLEYMMRNDAIYTEKHIKGMSTVSFNTGQHEIKLENAFVNRMLDTAPAERSYNVTQGIHYTSKIDEATLAQLKAEGYILVTLEDAVKMFDETRVKSFFVKASEVTSQPLKRTQLPYRAGGHTYYGDKHFAKQAVKRLQPDTKSELFDNPNTYAVGTKAEIDFWTRKMEAARIAYKDMVKSGNVDPEMLDDILEGTSIDGRKFVDNMEKGVFEAETEFVTKYDRELPDEYVGANDFVEDGMNGYLRTNQRMYTGGKGEDLMDFMGREANIIDPYQAINKSLMNVANMSSFSDYKLSAMERWVNTYARGSKKFFDFKPGASESAIFSEARALPGVSQDIVNKANKQRDLIKRTIGWRTEQDLQNAARARSIAEWVNGDNPFGARNRLARDVGNWFDNADPVGALREYAFDAKLGLLNPAQLPLQASTMAAIFTLSPKHAMHGMANLHFLNVYLSKSGTEHYLDTLVKRGVHEMSGFKDPKEFKAFMRSSKDSGFLDIGGTHGMINNHGPDAALSEFGVKEKEFREKARFFFNTGEQWNRSVAMHVAWKETREAFPSLSTSDPNFIRRWEGRAEEYAFNMSRESQATWQRGIWSIPTQFWAYQSRMLEAMMGNTFTPAQRFRLVLGQAVMYGSAGVPIAGLISDKLKAESGGAPSLDTFWGTIDRGVIDKMFYGVTGADMTFSKRYASGNWITDMVRELFGASPYGKKSFAEMATGATGSTVFRFMGDGWNIIDKMIKYTTAEGGGDIGEAVTKDDWIRLAGNITTVSSAHKAWLISQHGTLETTKGQTIYAGLPSNAAWEMMLLGAEPGATADMAAKMAYLKDKSQQVKDAVKVFDNYAVKALNDPKNADAYAREIKAYSDLLPEDIRAKALKQRHQNLDPSLYDGITKQVEKAMAEQKIIEGMQ